MSARTCQGCGVELPPSKGPVTRKWCSGRCRKRSYGDPCVDCGTPTRFGAETKRVPEPRCPAHALERRRESTTRRADRVLEMRRAGLTNRDIAAQLDMPAGMIGNIIYRAKQRGALVGPPPYWLRGQAA